MEDHMRLNCCTRDPMEKNVQIILRSKCEITFRISIFTLHFCQPNLEKTTLVRHASSNVNVVIVPNTQL